MAAVTSRKTFYWCQMSTQLWDWSIEDLEDLKIYKPFHKGLSWRDKWDPFLENLPAWNQSTISESVRFCLTKKGTYFSSRAEAYHLEAFNFPYRFETMLRIIPNQWKSPSNFRPYKQGRLLSDWLICYPSTQTLFERALPKILKTKMASERAKSFRKMLEVFLLSSFSEWQENVWW